MFILAFLTFKITVYLELDMILLAQLHIIIAGLID
jgi:hypothetical protein